MIESKYTTQRAPIQRWTLNDEQTMLSQGWVNTGVTFANGQGTFNGSSYLTSKLSVYNGVYSIRIKCTAIAKASTSYIFDARGTNNDGLGRVAIDTVGNTVSATGGTSYVNGVNTNTTTSNVPLEVVVTGITLKGGTGTNGSFIGAAYPLSLPFLGTIDLIEIYDYTLSASEVKNLYEGKKNRTIAEGMVLGPELVVNGGFDTDTGWTKQAGWTIENGTANKTSGSTGYLFQSFVGGVAGKRYLVSYSLTSISAGNVNFKFEGGNPAGAFRSTVGQYTEEVTLITTGNFYLSGSLVFAGSIDNVSVREILYSKTLDFDPRQGAIIDRTGLRTLTPTDVTIVRDGQSYAAKFNGTTSKIDTGSDFIGVKPVTVCAWVKLTTYGGGVAGRILDNVKFYYWTSNSTNIKITSDGASEVTSAFASILLNKYYFLTITRKADGKTSFYIGDTKTTPILSGSADQASGTPVAGTTNIFIGNRTAGDRSINGQIKLLQVYDGILDLATITQIYSSTLNSI